MKDIWDYIHTFDIPYCDIYDKGMQRTGCMFCGFGIHLSKNDRFEWLKEHYPKAYKIMMDDLGYMEVIDFIRKHIKLGRLVEL